MIVKLLTEQHLEFLSLKGGCTGLSESTLVKMPHCLKSHVLAHFMFFQSSGTGLSGTGLSESTLVKMPHCLKSHVLAHFMFFQSSGQ